MAPTVIFVSSVHKELEDKRRMVKAFVEGDPLLRRYFTTSLFEDLPASDRRADEVYLDKGLLTRSARSRNSLIFAAPQTLWASFGSLPRSALVCTCAIDESAKSRHASAVSQNKNAKGLPPEKRKTRLAALVASGKVSASTAGLIDFREPTASERAVAETLVGRGRARAIPKSESRVVEIPQRIVIREREFEEQGLEALLVNLEEADAFTLGAEILLALDPLLGTPAVLLDGSVWYFFQCRPFARGGSHSSTRSDEAAVVFLAIVSHDD